MAAGALFTALAALTKTEGQVGALVLVGLALVRHRSNWRGWAPLAATTAGVIGLWALVIRPGPQEHGDWSRLRDLLRGGTDVHERLTMSVSRVATELGPLVGLSAATVVVLLVLARLTRRPLVQPGLLSLLLLVAGYAVLLPVTFAIRPEPIDFLLDVSAYRTVVAVRLLVWVDLVLAGVAAARALGIIGTSAQGGAPSITDPGAGAPSPGVTS